MKIIYVTFDDDEFKKIKKIKNRKNLTWKEFILEQAGFGIKIKQLKGGLKDDKRN